MDRFHGLDTSSPASPPRSASSPRSAIPPTSATSPSWPATRAAQGDETAGRRALETLEFAGDAIIADTDEICAALASR
jgi:hypothetical protein